MANTYRLRKSSKNSQDQRRARLPKKIYQTQKLPPNKILAEKTNQWTSPITGVTHYFPSVNHFSRRLASIGKWDGHCTCCLKQKIDLSNQDDSPTYPICGAHQGIICFSCLADDHNCFYENSKIYICKYCLWMCLRYRGDAYGKHQIRSGYQYPPVFKQAVRRNWQSLPNLSLNSN